MSEKTSSPKFDAPPVIETVLSAQFAPLPGYTDAHSGWFWKTYLSEKWTEAKAATLIDDSFERFGDERKWEKPGGINIRQGINPDRLQIIRSEDEQDRMIQVQSSRFIYNWRRSPEKSETYPSYDTLLPEFREKLEKFEAFTKDASLGDLDFNQWEVIYVNHIPRGDLWDTFNDWPSIFPFLSFPPTTGGEKHKLDALKNGWSFVIGDNLGRLHISIGLARQILPGNVAGPEMIEVKLIARGPIDKNRDINLYSGFDIGHDSIVNTFAEITSEEAHKYWKRTE